MKTSNFCMKVERSNFNLVPNSALSTDVFLQSKCNMHGRYGHIIAGAGVAPSHYWNRVQKPDSSLIMPEFDLTGELFSLKIELHMLIRPITEKVHSGNGPVLLVLVEVCFLFILDLLKCTTSCSFKFMTKIKLAQTSFASPGKTKINNK